MKFIKQAWADKTIHFLMNTLATAVFLFQLMNPHLVTAEENTPSLADLGTSLSATPAEHLLHPHIHLPNRVATMTLTAYSSSTDQTDTSPFMSASGVAVHDGMIATNGLPFGTIIKIPALFGDKSFVVEDRMNSRYSGQYLDIWFSTQTAARHFGVRHALVEIYLPKN